MSSNRVEELEEKLRPIVAEYGLKTLLSAAALRLRLDSERLKTQYKGRIAQNMSVDFELFAEEVESGIHHYMSEGPAPEGS